MSDLIPSVMSDAEIDRYWSKVVKGGPDECWSWTGSHFSTGYPLFSLKRKPYGAHRIAAFLAHGPGEGWALHSCDNRRCLNPAHIRWGTPADNMRDREERGRTSRGEAHTPSKLNDDAVRRIRESYTGARGDLVRLGREFGVTDGTIDAVIRRRTWRHVA